MLGVRSVKGKERRIAARIGADAGIANNIDEDDDNDENAGIYRSFKATLTFKLLQVE